jgi:hypothetical protein
MTIQAIVERFNTLAQQEKWFEIQDELFSDDVKSIEPPGSPYMTNAAGKANVREKATVFVQKIEAVHGARTTAPVIGGDYFAVGREVDITVKGLGRVQINQVMLYQVKDGQIVSEQFFY